MISKYTLALTLAAVLLMTSMLPAHAFAALARAFGGRDADDDLVAFCCQSIDSNGNGTGCYAVPPGGAGAQACKSAFLDCGGGPFNCSSGGGMILGATQPPRGMNAPSLNCSCGSGLFR